MHQVHQTSLALFGSSMTKPTNVEQRHESSWKSTRKQDDDAKLYSANIVRLVDEKKLLLEQNETTLKHKDALTEALVDAQSRLAALAHLPSAQSPPTPPTRP